MQEPATGLVSPVPYQPKGKSKGKGKGKSKGKGNSASKGTAKGKPKGKGKSLGKGKGKCSRKATPLLHFLRFRLKLENLIMVISSVTSVM